MADSERAPQPPFLKRWSQRKLAASRDAAAPPVESAKGAGTVPVPTTTPAAPFPARVEADESPLPPVESLSFDSDFAAFLRPNVDESLKRQALHKLFADPHFNVMDGLDVYIDDYGKFVPMSPELVAQLNHAKFLFDPPKTRVNEQGNVEDVPVEPPVEPTIEPSAEGSPDPAGVAIASEAEAGLEPGPPPIHAADSVAAPVTTADESKQ